MIYYNDSEKDLLAKFHEHCGITSSFAQKIRKVCFVNDNGEEKISVTVHYVKSDFDDEFWFGPNSNLYNFLLEYFHLDA